MNIEVKGINVNYEVSGEGRDVLILHGWGTSAELMRPAAESFEGKMKVYNLDLPGFGQSEEPREDNWDIYAYADFVKEFCEKAGVVNPVVLAHSFGGRIALILAGKKLIPINKMILTGCAGIKPKRGADYYIKVYSYKLANKYLYHFLNHEVSDRFYSSLSPGTNSKRSSILQSSAEHSLARTSVSNLVILLLQ